jgi:hypothetical protein
MLIKLALLVAATLLFVWSHIHFEKVYKETSDAIVVMQYKVLDKKVWSMQEAQKEQVLAKDSSYDELQVLQGKNEGAMTKSKIGFWLAILFGIGTAVYFMMVLYRLLYVELIKGEGYKTIAAMIERSSGLSKADEHTNHKP